METNSADWVDFFKESGLPEPSASKYAVIFSKHRIQLNMLKDLSKEILYDMGIRTIGDVIAILRHAKEVDEETTKVKILGKDPRRKTLNDTLSNVNTAKSVEDSGLKRRLDDESVQRTKVRKILPAKDSNELESHEYMSSESTYVIKMPSILPAKVSNSVFKRLGSQEEPIKQPIVHSNSSSVFSRLGTSQPVRVVNPISKSTSVLRGAEGASSRIFASSLPQRTVATVKPTNVLVRKSLADAKGSIAVRSLAAQRMLAKTNIAHRTASASSLQSMNNSTVSVKDRLGKNSNVLTTNAAKKIVLTAPQAKRNTLSLKKSIFDRLGPMKL